MFSLNFLFCFVSLVLFCFCGLGCVWFGGFACERKHCFLCNSGSFGVMFVQIMFSILLLVIAFCCVIWFLVS